jgi:hypothetical protein
MKVMRGWVRYGLSPFGVVANRVKLSAENERVAGVGHDCPSFFGLLVDHRLEYFWGSFVSGSYQSVEVDGPVFSGGVSGGELGENGVGISLGFLLHQGYQGHERQRGAHSNG